MGCWGVDFQRFHSLVCSRKFTTVTHELRFAPDEGSEWFSRRVEPRSDPTIDTSILLEKIYETQLSHIRISIDLLHFTTTNGSAMA